MKEQRPVLSVRISRELMDRLERLEEKTGVARSELVEQCLVHQFERQERVVGWLESSIKGPLISLLLHPKVLEGLATLVGSDAVVDETQQTVKKNVRARVKATRGAAKVATE